MPEFRSFRRRFEVELGLTERQVVERLLILGVRFGKEECPVLTGALRRDVKYELDADPNEAAGVFGNSLSYAPFVNLGTRKMTANPYLLRALARLTAFAEQAARG